VGKVGKIFAYQDFVFSNWGTASKGPSFNLNKEERSSEGTERMSKIDA
jgi:hypothetical protein